MSTPKVSPRLLAALVLVLTLIVGGLAGAVVDRTMVRPRRDSPPPGAPARAGGPDRDPQMQEKHREGFVQQMKRDLDLTPEQVTRIDAITRSGMQQMDALRRETRSRSHALIDKTRVQVDSVLTPAQREREQELWKVREAQRKAGASASGRGSDSTSGKR